MEMKCTSESVWSTPISYGDNHLEDYAWNYQMCYLNLSSGNYFTCVREAMQLSEEIIASPQHNCVIYCYSKDYKYLVLVRLH